MAVSTDANEKTHCQLIKEECQINDIQNLELYECGTFLIILTTDELLCQYYFGNVKNHTEKHLCFMETLVKDHRGYWVLLGVM